MPGGYRRASDLPQAIPVFPLDGAILLPGGELPLQIFEPRYLNMIDDAMAGDRMIGLVQLRSGGPRERPNMASVGCAGRITSFAETADGRYLITLTGICRFETGDELTVRSPYRQVRARFERFGADLAEEPDPPAGIDRPRFAKALKRYLNRRELDIDAETANGAPLVPLITSLSMGLPFDAAEKQALLEAPDMLRRFEVLTALLEIDSMQDGDDAPPSVQ